MTTTETTTPKVYVASLSDYNAGRLHGRWIDLEGKTTDEVWAAINAILADSPEARTCQWCGAELEEGKWSRECSHAEHFPGNAEEWAIHDFEGFGKIRLSEYESIETVVAAVDALDENEHARDALEAFLAEEWPSTNTADDVRERVEAFEESYAGSFDSPEDYARETVAELGWANIPAYGVTVEGRFGERTEVKVFEELDSYLDWDTIVRDMEFSGNYTFAATDDGKVHVFRTC